MQKCQSFKGKLNNMEQVTDIEKVSDFNFLNEEVEEFTSRWSQSLVNAKIPSYFKQKTFSIVYEA